MRSFVAISPDPDDDTTQVTIKIWDISDYGEKTIDYVSEVFRPDDSLAEIETNIVRDYTGRRLSCSKDNI